MPKIGIICRKVVSDATPFGKTPHPVNHLRTEDASEVLLEGITRAGE